MFADQIGPLPAQPTSAPRLVVQVPALRLAAFVRAQAGHATAADALGLEAPATTLALPGDAHAENLRDSTRSSSASCWH